MGYFVEPAFADQGDLPNFPFPHKVIDPVGDLLISLAPLEWTFPRHHKSVILCSVANLGVFKKRTLGRMKG